MWHEAMVGRPFPRIQAYWNVHSSVSVLRYRPFVPMLAWSLPGGAPLREFRPRLIVPGRNPPAVPGTGPAVYKNG